MISLLGNQYENPFPVIFGHPFLNPENGVVGTTKLQVVVLTREQLEQQLFEEEIQ